MSEYSGSLPSIEIAIALWLAPLAPLVAAMLALLRRSATREGSAAKGATDAGMISVAAAVVSLAVVAMNAFALVTLPADRRQVVSHGWSLLRIGSLDVNFTLGMDPTSALLALAVTSTVVAALVWGTFCISDPESRFSFAFGGSLALLGVLLLLLGDDWILLTAGALVAGVAAWSLSQAGDGARAVRGFALGRLGDAALLGAGALLVWGLGGDWIGGSDYLPDFRPRLVAVQIGAPTQAPAPEPGQRPKATRDVVGSLTMSALPGATLVIGGADLCATDADGRRGGVGLSGRPCRELAHTPFSRLPLPAALHDVEVLTGPGTQDLILEKLRVGATPETMLTVAGSTLVLREMRDQLAIRDASGVHVLRASLGKRRVLGQPLLGVVGALLALVVLFRGLLAAFALSSRSAESTQPGALAVLAAATDLTVGAIVLARTDFLLALLPRTALLLAVLAAVAMLLAAGRAAHAQNARSAIVSIAVAELGLAVVALAAGAHAGGVSLIAAHAFGLGAFALAVGSALQAAGAWDVPGAGEAQLAAFGGLAKPLPGHSRAAAVAALVVAGAPLPAVGIFWGRDSALQMSAALEGLGISGWVAAGLALFGSGVLSFAVWRLHYLVFAGERPRAASTPKAPSWLASASLLLAALGLAIGAIAVPSHVFAAGAAAPLETWLARFGSEAELSLLPDQSVRFAIVGVGYAAALAGWALARARYGTARAKNWVEREALRVGHRQLAAPPRALFDAVLGTPVLALSRQLNALDGAIETLMFGPPSPADVAQRGSEVASTDPDGPPAVGGEAGNEADAEAGNEADAEAGNEADAEAGNEADAEAGVEDQGAGANENGAGVDEGTTPDEPAPKPKRRKRGGKKGGAR